MSSSWLPESKREANFQAIRPVSLFSKAASIFPVQTLHTGQRNAQHVSPHLSLLYSYTANASGVSGVSGVSRSSEKGDRPAIHTVRRFIQAVQRLLLQEDPGRMRTTLPLRVPGLQQGLRRPAGRPLAREEAAHNVVRFGWSARGGSYVRPGRRAGAETAG